jgi:hypothetical protein
MARRSTLPNPKKEIDLEQLAKLAQMQLTYEEIAAFFGTSRQTLYNREEVREIIERERLNGNGSLRRDMWTAAKNGDRQMMIWLSKQYLGMKEKTESTGDGNMQLVMKMVEATPPAEENES